MVLENVPYLKEINPAYERTWVPRTFGCCGPAADKGRTFRLTFIIRRGRCHPASTWICTPMTKRPRWLACWVSVPSLWIGPGAQQMPTTSSWKTPRGTGSASCRRASRAPNARRWVNRHQGHRPRGPVSLLVCGARPRTQGLLIRGSSVRARRGLQECPTSSEAGGALNGQASVLTRPLCQGFGSSNEESTRLFHQEVISVREPAPSVRASHRRSQLRLSPGRSS